MSNFKVLQSEEVKAAFDRQTELGWNCYHEREHLENLFCQRFNFLLVVYSLFVTAAATVEGAGGRIAILLAGSVFIAALSLTMYRVYVKLIILLNMLHILDGHLFQTIEVEVKAMGRKALFGVNQLIGIYIPLFCLITFLVALLWNIAEYQQLVSRST